MPLKDLLQKHKALQGHARVKSSGSDSKNSAKSQRIEDDGINNQIPLPDFTFLRTTTHDQEIIEPPIYPGDGEESAEMRLKHSPEKDKKRRSFFRRSISAEKVTAITKEKEARLSEDSGTTTGTACTAGTTGSLPVRPKTERRLSERLGFTRSRSSTKDSTHSTVIPDNLGEAPPTTPAPLEAPDEKGRVQAAETKAQRIARESAWEKRAIYLALCNPLVHTLSGQFSDLEIRSAARTRRRSFTNAEFEADIQEAITLHEQGDLARSTEIFGKLADPMRANNPLSQVLYGLALRHGWGIEPSHSQAIYYLSLAARTSADLEQAALNAQGGEGAGGEAKGELVLASFELANCFRYGWGTKVDKNAARTYYEVAANLGDPDALEECAWCLMEGFGGAKDKFQAAQYYRLAECAGRKRVGDSWIWKDKYNAPARAE